MTPADQKLYNKLWVSKSDTEFAEFCASVILKKGWHFRPHERRGTIYQQQAAFTTALVIAYARPFKQSKGWKDISADLLAAYDEQEKALHDQLIKLRDTAYAHSDSGSYSIFAGRGFGAWLTTIVREPEMRITAEEATLFQAMSRKLLASIDVSLKALRVAERKALAERESK